VFNVSGGEIIVILLLALVVLGPEKLPEALRRAGRTYAELKKMGNSFQTEMRSVLDEPMKEMRDTADLLRKAVDVTVETATTDTRAVPPPSPAAVDEAVPEVAAATAELEEAAPDPPPDPATNTSAMDDEVEAATPSPSAPTPEPATPAPPTPAASTPVPASPTPASTDDDLINRTLSGD
jgi:sec-independent protein translocase protein TatB